MVLIMSDQCKINLLNQTVLSHAVVHGCGIEIEQSHAHLVKNEGL